MNNLNNYILEKLKLNKDFKYENSKKNWSIDKAEDGDFVHLNGTGLYFIYKCLNENKKYGSTSDTAIVYHVIYSVNSYNKIEIGPKVGVGNIGNINKYSLATEDEKEKFIEVLKKYGYTWDDNKKELIKVIKLK